jgi:hypothetical protein
MKNKTIFIIAFSIIAFTNPLLAKQDSTIVKRIEKIEATDQLEEREHQARLNELKLTAELEINAKQQQLLLWFIGFLGIGSLSGVVALLWYIPKKVQEEVDKEVRNRIEPIIKKNETSVVNLIDEYNEEKTLFQNKIIRVWGEPSFDTIKQVLNNVQFNPNHILAYDEVKQGQAYHILIINNEKGEILLSISPKRDGENEQDYRERVKPEKEKFEQQWKTIEEIISQQSANVCTLYYCPKNIRLPIERINDIPLQARVNFVNSPAQIYGNLLNTLKYQDKISKKYN